MERNEENEMLKLSEIDVNKCFIDDTVGFWDGFWERRNGLGAAPVYADPDSANLMIYHADLQPARGIISRAFFCEKTKKVLSKSLRNSIRPGGVSGISCTQKSVSGTISDIVC